MTYEQAYDILEKILDNWNTLSNSSLPSGYYCCTDHCHCEYSDGEELLHWLKEKRLEEYKKEIKEKI